MKPLSILPASLLIGAILLGATSCSAGEGKDITPSPLTSSSVLDAKPVVSVFFTENDKAREAAQAYFDTSKNKDVMLKLEEYGAKFNGRETAPTAEELQQLVADNPEAFKYADTSRPEYIVNAYIQLLTNAMNETTYEITPQSVIVDDLTKQEFTSILGNESLREFAEQAQVDGSKVASVDPTLVKIYQGGQKVSNEFALPRVAAKELDKAHLVKKDDGRWLMIPFG